MSASDNPRRRSRKLPARMAPVAFAFYMSAIMAFLMSFVITAVSQGIGPGYSHSVMTAYVLAMPVAFGCVLMVRPLVLKLIAWTVDTAA